MTPDHRKEFVELLHQNPDHALVALVHELLGSISAIQGTTELLSMVLKHPEAEFLSNIETLKKLNGDILKYSQRAANLLIELRTEVREQSSKDEY